jgi:alpha-L-fucosidase 2
MLNSVIAATADLTLRYDHPAVRWEQEALPIGNGYLGAMLLGRVDTDQIQFNEENHPGQARLLFSCFV